MVRGDAESSASHVSRAHVDDDVYVRQARARLGRVVRRKWRLDQLLGVGGMAAVYAATHRNGSRVAIKMLHPQLNNEHTRSRFLREGYVANAVGHPGAVRVLDDDEAEDGSVFLVMELLEGESLEGYASRRIQLAPADALAIGEQILEVLAAAHTRGVVHRDVKPDNVFLCTDGRVKLLDFGIARLRELSQTMGVTQHGFLLGTPAFMAPEQARGDWEKVDGRTDLWSLGALLYRVMSGHPVHRASSHVETLLAASTRAAPSLREVLPGVEREVAELVDGALAFDMDARWRDAEAMLAKLREVYAKLGFTASVKVRAKLAADATQRVSLPSPPAQSEEFDRARALSGEIDEPDPTEIMREPISREMERRTEIRSLIGLDDQVEREGARRASAPSAVTQSGVQSSDGPSLASIFDDADEPSIARPLPVEEIERLGLRGELPVDAQGLAQVLEGASVRPPPLDHTMPAVRVRASRPDVARRAAMALVIVAALVLVASVIGALVSG